MRVKEYFRTYSKPMVKTNSCTYNPDLIDSSQALLSLYVYIHTIVEAIQRNVETQ